MDKIEQITKSLFDEVKKELDQQMQSYKTEITDKFAIFVPTGSKEEIKKFVEREAKYYEDWFSDDFGKPKVIPFSWERYHKFVRENFRANDLEKEISNRRKEISNRRKEISNRRREVVLKHTRIFLYAQIIRYLHSLQFDENSMPLFEQGHHKITVRFQPVERRKDKKSTILDKRESAALYEVLADNKCFLGFDQRPKSNVAASIMLYSGFSHAEIYKEIDLVTDEDKINLKKKLIKLLQESLPPNK